MVYLKRMNYLVLFLVGFVSLPLSSLIFTSFNLSFILLIEVIVKVTNTFFIFLWIER